MVNAVNSPHSTNHGTGHHAGAGSPRTCFGSPSKTKPWTAATKAKNPYAMAEIGTPNRAASMRAPR